MMSFFRHNDSEIITKGLIKKLSLRKVNISSSEDLFLMSCSPAELIIASSSDDKYNKNIIGLKKYCKSILGLNKKCKFVLGFKY